MTEKPRRDTATRYDSTSRNPYHTGSDGPSLRLSVLAYFDILGYSEMVRDANSEGAAAQALRDIYIALSGGRDWLEERAPNLALDRTISRDRYALKAFTDNIVIGWPIRGDAESELGDAFGKLIDFQFHMATAGFFVRGAIAIGDAYVDEIAVFGEALIESHRAESQVARDPRIVLTASAVKAAQMHLQYYGSPRHAPQVRALLRDADGPWFVNYLQAVLYAEDDCGPFYPELLKHKAIVEEKLARYKSKPPIWSKYAWVAAYHNYFCDSNCHWFDAAYKIDLDLYRAAPTLIVAAKEAP
jgi:hypothetical protein